MTELRCAPSSAIGQPFDVYADDKVVGFVFPNGKVMKDHARGMLKRNDLSEKARLSYENQLDLPDEYRITLGPAGDKELTLERYDEFLAKLKKVGIDGQPKVDLLSNENRRSEGLV